MESETAHPALQAHVAYFDTDNDDIIWPTDTYKAFRTIGFSIFFSVLSMIVIHSGFSYLMWGALLPDPCFRLRVSRINRAIHGSDSGVYTQTGVIDESRFNFVFALYSAEPHTHLSFREGVALVRGNRNPFDVVRGLRSIRIARFTSILTD
ncbi:Caleosin [Mycena olivaceomarginata]|nr:Caleosin [Mycena olivaceomarginata]